ncbi:Flp pilus assembly protein TadG [Pseudarthrobacter siccitolerans]|uniref:Flp pilus assembly protein TadG n=1 Tax=Pseudarthrobacter siccitolerans TaxID=861266 RepID=A0ABU0PIA4_9MICC|nr:pilus assembly protein TadG-related protein [Pseudarthrobacter siccitolerans]MDQ0673683.1 Flp pilus assembly protein TadG [Pseudarthrobacter siccitolerans]
MRRLIPARRVATGSDNERGVAGVLVALMMLVLIGAGAMAVDVGQIYAERAQLQNGADAAALAVAYKCHKSGCDQDSANTIAKELSNANANDGGSKVLIPVELDVEHQVTVRTSTAQGKDGPGFLSKMFASALPAPAVNVGAHATAIVDFPSSGSGFPLALSDKCFNLSKGSQTAQVQKISYAPGGTCTGPSGTQIPGGWGWLDQDSPCVADTTLGSNLLGSDPGKDPPFGCAAILLEWKATILAGGEVKVAFPVFSDASNKGQNGYFTIIGYATFKIWGWKFGQNKEFEFRNTKDDPDMTNSLACDIPANQRCIIGQFVKFDSIKSSGGGGKDFGTSEIRLIH